MEGGGWNGARSCVRSTRGAPRALNFCFTRFDHLRSRSLVQSNRVSRHTASSSSLLEINTWISFGGRHLTRTPRTEICEGATDGMPVQALEFYSGIGMSCIGFADRWDSCKLVSKFSLIACGRGSSSGAGGKPCRWSSGTSFRLGPDGLPSVCPEPWQGYCPKGLPNRYMRIRSCLRWNRSISLPLMQTTWRAIKPTCG